jgi:hypothetical protein
VLVHHGHVHFAIDKLFTICERERKKIVSIFLQLFANFLIEIF